MFHPQELRIFPAQPDVLDLGNRQKELHSPYRYNWEQNGYKVRLTIPAGLIYNGASVPQFVWSIYPPHALDRAAVFHDFIYHNAGVMPPGVHQYYDGLDEEWKDVGGVWTRNSADTLFFKHLQEDPGGPGWFRQQAAYRAVRIFGGSRWG
jgi:hypothetical protein